MRLSDVLTFLAPPPSDDLGDDQAVERKGSNSALFGLDSLDLIPATGSVYLVADEIEALTLRFHGLPALAVPPVARWAEDWPALDEAPVVFVVTTDTDEPSRTAGLGSPTRPSATASASSRLLKDFGIRHLHRHSPRFFRDGWKTICDGAIALAAFEYRRAARERRAQAARRCAGLVNDPDILARFAIDIDRAGFAGDTREPKLLYLVTITRLFEQPVSAAVKGPSSAGKSFLVKRGARVPARGGRARDDVIERQVAHLPDGVARAPPARGLRGRRDGRLRAGDPAVAVERGAHPLRHRRLRGRLVADWTSDRGRGPYWVHHDHDSDDAPPRERDAVPVAHAARHAGADARGPRYGERRRGSPPSTRPVVGASGVPAGREHRGVVPFASALVGGRRHGSADAPRSQRAVPADQGSRAPAPADAQTRRRIGSSQRSRTTRPCTTSCTSSYAENVEQAVPAEVRELVQAVQQMGPDQPRWRRRRVDRALQAKLASSGTSINRTSVQRRLKRALESDC